MSIENFFLSHPVSPDFKKRMMDERQPNRSAVATFALELAKEAGNGLREATRNLGDLRLDYGIKLDNLQFLPQDDRKRVAINYAGVVFGVSIPPLEKSCDNGYFDLGEWCSLYNRNIAKTPFAQLQVKEEKGKEILSQEHWFKLRHEATENPTFSSLFTEDIEYMPESLRILLLRSGVILSVIQQNILPFWKPPVKFFVAS